MVKITCKIAYFAAYFEFSTPIKFIILKST